MRPLPDDLLVRRGVGQRHAGVPGQQFEQFQLDVAHLAPVVIGEDDGVSVQIVSGLSANDRVIQAPPDSLIEGEKVTVVNPDSGKSEGGK